MRIIDIRTLDTNLLADMAGENLSDYAAYEADDATATVSNQSYHIVFHAGARRGGIVFVGSGSNGSRPGRMPPALMRCWSATSQMR